MENLTLQLLARNAIPEHRLRYVDDDEFNVGGRGSSRYEIIERNGWPTPALRNPAFLKCLRYFLHGPALPDSVIRAFQQKVAECGMPFTASDALTVADYARELSRTHELDASSAPDEFYKLALECGLDSGDARTVRELVMKMKTSRKR